MLCPTIFIPTAVMETQIAIAALPLLTHLKQETHFDLSYVRSHKKKPNGND